MTDSPWSPATASGRGSGDRAAGRFIEIVTVLLLGLATLGSAWSAFQVSQWNGIETDEARASGALRIESSREFALASQKVTYDSAAVSQYAQAVVADDVRLQTFLRDTIIRPGFLPKLDSWTAQVAAGETPTNLLNDAAYIDELFATSTSLDEQAAAATTRSEDAGATADDYVLLTLFFASALFFAGITASFSTRAPRLALLTGAAVTLLAAGALLASYPVA